MIEPEFYWVVATFLLANLLLGLMRLTRGPSRADRLLMAQLFTTITTAVLVLLAQALALPALRDVALLFALLGVIVSMAFVRLTPPTATSREADL